MPGGTSRLFGSLKATKGGGGGGQGQRLHSDGVQSQGVRQASAHWTAARRPSIHSTSPALSPGPQQPQPHQLNSHSTEKFIKHAGPKSTYSAFSAHPGAHKGLSQRPALSAYRPAPPFPRGWLQGEGSTCGSSYLARVLRLREASALLGQAAAAEARGAFRTETQPAPRRPWVPFASPPSLAIGKEQSPPKEPGGGRAAKQRMGKRGQSLPVR